ncbi:Sterile alpha motif [Blomia tropicalis]|nr:Sterile alpha motif [Blomia tropicalis]
MQIKQRQCSPGLDDSVLPYVQFFVNKNVNGCQLLLLTANDLIDLNIHKTGHQEVILEAVELLKQLHYSFTSETLQTIALQDLSPVSNSTLNSVAEIIQAAKDFSKWVECHPFANQAKFTDPLKKIIKLSIEMASTAQRDQFVQGPNDVIRARCKELAEICDRMIQNLTDSLAMMAATLEIILVTRTHGEDLGMHIHSSYSGVHLIGGLQYDSPIARHGQVEEGDEIVQVNYQTVVGWQLKKLVSSMRQFPKKIVLTVKKRPRHCPSSTSFTPSGPFSIPNPDITYGTAKIGPEGCQRSCQRATIVNVDQYYGIPLPVIPLPENATIISTIDSSTILYETSDPLYSTGPSYPVPVLMINSIPVAGGCLAPKTSTSYTSAGGYHYGQDSIYGKARIPPPVAMLAKTSIQEPIVTVSPTKPQTLSSYNATEKRTEMDQHQTSVKTLEAAAAAASSSTTDTVSNVYNGKVNANSIGLPIESNSMKPSGHCQCGSGVECTDSDSISNDDNDSAFYSGRTTSANDINGSGSGHSSGGGSAYGHPHRRSCKDHVTNGSRGDPNGSIPPPLLPPNSSKVSNTMAKASTLPANVQPCTTTNSDSTRPTTMTSAQLSTITHLTSLAQNIRLASTVPTMSQSANNTRSSNVGGGHSTNGAQLDLVLAKKVNAKLESLNAGECSIGDHEDILYVFGGDSPNGAISNSPTRSDRPLPLLGPMILDRSALNSNRSRWTKSNGNLRENCLYTRPINDDQPSSTTSSKPKTKSQVCLELLVHLPGYYILVNKSDLMECEDSSTPKPINDQPETSILLYVFKLVTYHHLYMFAVDNPPALARWIVKFGYKFCCNPSPDQLCFTYYLSPIHVDPISKQKRLKRITPKVTVQPPTPTDEKHLTRSISSLGTNESELESDDYRDLTMDSRRKNPINNNENDRAVTFDTGNRCTLRVDDANGDDQMYNDGRRFAKSPHPRGSARFACKPLPNNHDFIDSVIPNPTRSLAAAICELESKIALSRTSPPELPPRSSSSNGTNVAPTPTPITTTQNNSTTTATLTTTTATSTATINTMAPSNETSTSTIPRPKPRISKMASSSNNGTMSGSVSSSPNTTQMANLVSTSAAKASARAKAQSLVSAREHLAPIPVVPEKSAAISQTIQHFANLQRQNQLRRSNQQLNQQSSPSKASVKAEAKTATTNVINNSDYDYIGVQRPTLNTPKKEETNENTSNRSPGIGNPLYCVVPPTAEIAKMESNVEKTQQPIQSNTSAVDREYNRLYGERAKSSRKAIFSNASTSCDERSSSSTSSSSSSGPNSTESSPPPPKEAPPPPPPAPTPTQPPIIRDCVLKSASNDNNGSSVSDDNNNVIDQPTIKQTGNPFESVRIHSPKMSGKRISTKGRLPSLPMTMKTDDQPVNNVPSQPSSPPTLLPRRSNTKQNTPPPLPTTSHPAKVATEMRRQVPPPPTPSSSSQANSGKPITATSTNSSQSNSVRHLNRSFSDAYALKSPSRIKPRKSLESGLRMDDDCNSRVPTSTRIMVFEQLLLSATGSTNNGGETANRSAPMMGVTMLSKKRLSNVSAEAIERALAQYSTTTSTSSSSSSSDQTGAIQSPTSPPELKQNLSQLWDNWDVDNDSVSDDDNTDTITVVSNQACPIRDPPNTPIIKNSPNAIINNNNGSDSQVDPCIDEKLQSPSKLKSANHKQWEKVDQTLVETKRRLLKHQ